MFVPSTHQRPIGQSRFLSRHRRLLFGCARPAAPQQRYPALSRIEGHRRRDRRARSAEGRGVHVLAAVVNSTDISGVGAGIIRMFSRVAPRNGSDDAVPDAVRVDGKTVECAVTERRM